MMKTFKILMIGMIAGGLDLIPLILVDAPIFNMLSIVVFWVVTAYMISKTKLIENTVLNGLMVSILLMIPMALAVSATNPKDFIPMMSMAFLLGPCVGFMVGKA